MNIINNKLIHLAIVSALLIPTTSALASHTVDIDTSSSGKVLFSNIKAEMNNTSLSVSGKMSRGKSGHLIIPGKIVIEVLNNDGKVVKTVKVTSRRHRHHVNKAYGFSRTIALDTHDISKVRFSHD